MSRARVPSKCFFGEKLRQCRVRAGLDQTDLGKKVGLSRRVISYYETYAPAAPAGDLVLKFAKVFRVSTDSLLDPDPDKMEMLDKKELPSDMRQLRRLLRIRALPRYMQRAVHDHIDALLASVEKKKKKSPKR
jgi:transcriptional regulator with XRE-family HTH domain